MKLLSAALLAALPCAWAKATTVRATGKGPTGYVVDFVYRGNATSKPSNVLLGNIPLFSDQLHASPSKTSGYSPFNWKSDQFPLALFNDSDVNQRTYAGFNMTYNKATNEWEFTLPLPSGTYNYAYYPDCQAASNGCLGIVDETNLPIEALPGDQTFSVIQVPFDHKFQARDYDWELPIEDKSKRGSISFHQYTSPGSTYPKPNIHSTGIYLPSEYAKNPHKQYPVLYLSHGGGGNDSDWFNLARAHYIMDFLIANGELEPTVVVTPNFYNLGFTIEQYATNTTVEGFDMVGLNAFYERVRQNYQTILIPWVEKNFRVIPNASARAFAGLSLGGGLASTMLFNATTTFSHFSVMSNVPFPEPGSPLYNNTELAKVGIFLGAGFYDAAFQNSINAGARLDAVGLSNYLNLYPMYSAHQWETWQEILLTWGRTGLWKSVPYKP